MARPRGSRWQADVRTPGGERLRKTFATQSQAEAWEREAGAAIEDGRPIPEPGTGMAGRRDLSTLGSLFDHVTRTHWNSLRSAETLIRCGKEVVEHFGRNAIVAEITSADVADFAASRAELGQSKATANRKLAALSKMLRVAHRAGAIDRLPHIDWRQEAKTKFRYLDDGEETAVLLYWLAVQDRDQHDLTMFLIDTGARCFTEAIPIKWEDCGGKIATFWNTKTNKPRTVPLTARCRDMLARRKALRPGSWGPFQGIAKNTMRGRWDRMRSTLSFHDVTPHTLRHTCCTRLIKGGADIRRVMEWLGHTTIETTLRYAHVRPNSLEDILHILDAPKGASRQALRDPVN